MLNDGMSPVNLLPTSSRYMEASFPFPRYGHYIRQLPDRQPRQLSGIMIQRQQYVLNKDEYEVISSFRKLGNLDKEEVIDFLKLKLKRYRRQGED